MSVNGPNKAVDEEILLQNLQVSADQVGNLSSEFMKGLLASGILSGRQLEQLSVFVEQVSAQEEQEEVDSSERDRQWKGRLAAKLGTNETLSMWQACQCYCGHARRLLVGNHILVDPVGAGGMGHVYRAVHKSMRGERAVKIPTSVKNPMERERVTREIVVTNYLSDEAKKEQLYCYPTAYDYGKDDQHGLYFSLELLQGQTLRQVVKSRDVPLDDAEILRIIYKIAKGLAFAEKHHVVHRDIKPENIMIDGDRVVIMDFGLCKVDEAKNEELKQRLLDADVGGELRYDTSHTQTGTFGGTPRFMPPEQQIDFKNADSRADVYSLGCVLYVLSTGENPYPQATGATAVLHAHGKGGPALPSDVSPVLAQVYAHMRSKKVDNRKTPTDLVEFMEERGLTGETPIERVRRESRFTRGNIAAIGGAAALIFAGVSYLATKDSDSPDPNPTGNKPVAQGNNGLVEGEKRALEERKEKERDVAFLKQLKKFGQGMDEEQKRIDDEKFLALIKQHGPLQLSQVSEAFDLMNSQRVWPIGTVHDPEHSSSEGVTSYRVWCAPHDVRSSKTGKQKVNYILAMNRGSEILAFVPGEKAHYFNLDPNAKEQERDFQLRESSHKGEMQKYWERICSGIRLVQADQFAPPPPDSDLARKTSDLAEKAPKTPDFKHMKGLYEWAYWFIEEKGFRDYERK